MDYIRQLAVKMMEDSRKVLTNSFHAASEVSKKLDRTVSADALFDTSCLLFMEQMNTLQVVLDKIVAELKDVNNDEPPLELTNQYFAMLSLAREGFHMNVTFFCVLYPERRDHYKAIMDELEVQK